jgi:uncharacterized phage protein gp47/JayE
MSFGLTETGFKRKMFEDIMKDMTDDLIGKFGAINTDPEDPLMQLTSTFAYELSSVWELAEYVNNSMYPDSAFGASLDYICSYLGIKRLQATKTKTKAKLTGKNQIFIPVGSQVTADNVNTTFLLTENISLTNEACYDITLNITLALNAFEYFIYINNQKFSYIKQAGDTIAIIINNLVTAINLELQNVQAINLNNQLFIKSTNIELTMEIYISQYIFIEKLSSIGEFIANDSGYISLAINSLINIQTPVAGWISVINETTPEIGRNIETDEELRIRRELSISLIGSGTIDAIRARLLNLTGVTSVFVLENATDSIVDLLPPHSFECLVSGGNNDEIAKTIWNAKGAGIETFGNITVQIIDSEGNIQNVKFSRPIPLYIYADISIQKDANLFPIDGDNIIKNNFVSQISKLNVGDDILYQSLFTSIYSVPGVSVAIISIGGSLTEQKPVLSSQNILIEKSQVQKTDINKITILNIG